MTTDTLHNWEKWPVGALMAAAGLNTALWYVGAALPIQAVSIVPWLIVIAGIASVVAIDGALIATIAGMRAGRTSWWSVGNIAVTAVFTGLAALTAHQIHAWLAPWLHGLFAATIVTYAMHLAQPHVEVGIALALREQETTRREADVTSREQAVTTKLASADNYVRQCEQEMTSRFAELARREQEPTRIEQVEYIRVASYELTWQDFERIAKRLTSDAPSMSSLRRIVASVKEE